MLPYEPSSVYKEGVQALRKLEKRRRPRSQECGSRQTNFDKLFEMENETRQLRYELDCLKLTKEEEKLANSYASTTIKNNWLGNEELKIHFQVKNSNNLNDLVGKLLDDIEENDSDDTQENMHSLVNRKNQQISQLCKLVDQLIIENSTENRRFKQEPISSFKVRRISKMS